MQHWPQKSVRCFDKSDFQQSLNIVGAEVVGQENRLVIGIKIF
jgi:hypothetical protein